MGASLMDYLSYTTKVYQLVQRFSLASVLLYDREYRKIQSNMNFRLGTHVQHLHTLFLQSRSNSSVQTNPIVAKGGAANQPGTRSRPDRRTDNNFCRNFNSDKGCSLEQCEFRHRCLVPGCGHAHSAVSHSNLSSEKKVDFEVNPLPGLRLTAWEEEFDNDCDCHFILNGKEQGFDIIDDSADIKPVTCKNHPSASPSSPLYDKATAQVIQEIKNGHYVIYDKPPQIVSLMAAIPTIHTNKKEDLYLKH